MSSIPSTVLRTRYLRNSMTLEATDDIYTTILFRSSKWSGGVYLRCEREFKKNRVGSTVHGLYNLVPTTVHTW